MTTYSKETALYAKDEIKNGIESAGETASKFLSIDNTGIMVYDGSEGPQTPSSVSNSTNNVFIDDYSVNIRKGANKLASFGSTTTIGKTDGSQSYLLLDYHSMKMIDYNLDPYLIIEDLRNEDGEYELTESFEYVALDNSILVSFSINEILSVKVNDVDVAYSFNPSFPRKIQLTQRPTGSFIVIAKYTSKSDLLKTFTLGYRDANDDKPDGPFSYAIGYNLIASGVFSYAEGYNTQANGDESHSEGNSTKANGPSSHSEGYHTESNGIASHASGYFTKANGDESVAFGFYTCAESDKQVVIGEYNKIDNYGDYYFIIGNGSGIDDEDRANALTVDLNGDLDISGNYRINKAQIGSCISRTGSNTQNLTTSPIIIPMDSTPSINRGNAFSTSSNGIVCQFDGFVHAIASIRYTSGFTANDYIIAGIYKGSTAQKSSRIRTPFAVYGGDMIIDHYFEVSAGDEITIKARNETGGRGTVDNSITRLTVCYISA